jgi:hypothetical protein
VLSSAEADSDDADRDDDAEGDAAADGGGDEVGLHASTEERSLL